MDKKKLYATLVMLLLLIIAFLTYLIHSNTTSNIDQLNKKLAGIEESIKTLQNTCTAPAPEPCPACQVAVEKPPLKKLLRDDIYKIIFSYKDELNVCYKMRGPSKPATRRLVIALTIKNTGEVLEAKTTNSDINNKKVENCITKLIKKMRFPEFDGDLYKDEIYISFDSRSLI